MKVSFSKKIIAYTIAFLSVLFAVLLLVLPKEEISENENRYLASFPKLTKESFFGGDYMADIEIYINDHFPFRDTIVGIKSQVDRAIGKKDFNDIYLGQDGFLIQAYDGYDLSLQEKHAIIIEDFAKAADVKTYVILTPTSNAVYANQKPPHCYDADQIADIEHFYQLFNTAVPVNVHTSLLENHDDALLYFKQDHHWNTNGAYLAYADFCGCLGLAPIAVNQFSVQTVSDDFYGTYYSLSKLYTLPPDTIQIYQPQFERDLTVSYVKSGVETDTLYCDDWLGKKDQYAYFLNGNVPEIVITNHSIPEKESLLVVKDSYANCFIPFLTSHYRTIYVLDMRYCSFQLSDYVKENAIDQVLFLYNIQTIRNDMGILKVK